MSPVLFNYCVKARTAKSRPRFKDYSPETSDFGYQFLEFLGIKSMLSSRGFLFLFSHLTEFWLPERKTWTSQRGACGYSAPSWFPGLNHQLHNRWASKAVQSPEETFSPVPLSDGGSENNGKGALSQAEPGAARLVTYSLARETQQNICTTLSEFPGLILRGNDGQWLWVSTILVEGQLNYFARAFFKM